MQEPGKPLTPLVEETEGEEKEEALLRLNEEYKDSKHVQIYRFLRDQEELNRRFAQIALNSEDEESESSSDGSADVISQKMSFYTGRGRRITTHARSGSFDSLEQNLPSDDDRSNLNDLEDDLQISAAQKKERKRKKQKSKILMKKNIPRPQTALGSRSHQSDHRTTFYGPSYEANMQTKPVYNRTESDPMPPAPSSSPNAEYGERLPQPVAVHPALQGQIDSRKYMSCVNPTTNCASTSLRYSSYGSTSRRPKSVAPSGDNTNFTHTPRARYSYGVSPQSTLDERTRQRLHAEAEGIIERQNQNNAAIRQTHRHQSDERTFITRLDCDESAYRRFSKSATGVRKSSTLNDLSGYKGNARPIKVLKLPPLDGSVINKNVHGTKLVGASRGGSGPTVAESLVG